MNKTKTLSTHRIKWLKYKLKIRIWKVFSYFRWLVVFVCFVLWIWFDSINVKIWFYRKIYKCIYWIKNFLLEKLLRCYSLCKWCVITHERDMMHCFFFSFDTFSLFHTFLCIGAIYFFLHFNASYVGFLLKKRPKKRVSHKDKCRDKYEVN